ncbi:MAG TPA: hypothetical protein VNK96_02780 [Fimbriimonadales bacterium]|nr:hypothetical protein [Fimbriimonadales bacterium]
MRRVTTCVGVTATLGLAVPIMTQSPPVMLVVPQPEVTLAVCGDFSRYEMPKPVPIIVTSQIPQWTIVATLLPLEGVSPQNDISCRIEITPRNASQTFSTPSTNSSTSIVLSTGKPTLLLQGGIGVNEYLCRFTISTGAFPAEGNYRGLIQFTVIEPTSKMVLSENRILFNYTVLPYLFFNFERNGLNFTCSGQPGEVISPNPQKVMITTNRANARIRFSISQLVHDSKNSVISTNHLGIGVGVTQKEAIRNAEYASFGIPSVVANPKRGNNIFFIAVKVRYELNLPPGMYRGVLTGEVVG